MTIDLKGVLGDAWLRWKRDRNLLTGVAGLLVFLPQLAVLLFVPAQPLLPENTADAAAMNEWAQVAAGYFLSYGPVILLCDAVAIFGSLTLYVSYLNPARLSVSGALRAAARLFPRFILAALLIQFACELGIALLILPGLYIAGRTSLVGPIFAAERPEGVIQAIRASFARTRGYGLALAALSGITILGSAFAAGVLRLLGETLGRAPLANPVSAVMIEIGSAAAVTLGTIATVLVRVALYRRIGRP
ncbi:MAG: hypothetical protein ABIS14_13270 [Sphingomonas sp.]